MAADGAIRELERTRRTGGDGSERDNGGGEVGDMDQRHPLVGGDGKDDQRLQKLAQQRQGRAVSRTVDRRRPQHDMAGAWQLGGQRPLAFSLAPA